MIQETFPMIVGGDEVPNERILLTKVESGLMMSGADAVRFLIVHCSATPEGRSLDFEACRRDHIRHRHFRNIGYHYYLTRDGTVHPGRPPEQVGAHCRGHNRHSIGICYEGGLDAQGQPCDTRTPRQREALAALVAELKQRFPHALVVGHRDLDPQKDCPCFEASRYND